MSINYLKGEECNCGKKHTCKLKNVLIGSGVIKFLPEETKKLGIKKAFVIADKNTYKAAGEKAVYILENSEIPFSKFVFGVDRLEPDENAVGSAIMHFDTSCDGILAVGSGVINDIAKILANVTKKPYIIVATAPSMDGYASETSSMSRDGLKVSINSKCPDVIIGDTDILKNAPIHMMKSGLGDMLAKYISICEWKIAHLLIGEYYCEEVAELIRQALKKCVDNAEGLLERDEKALETVFEGLVKGGIAMAYAGVSRPASGVEHYFSHIWDMRGLEFSVPIELHGTQCAYGTYVSAKLYEKIKQIIPDRNRALSYVKTFDLAKWNDELRCFLGKGADAMIKQEEKEGKYNIEKHAKRLDVIIDNWDKILEIIEKEIPDIKFIENLFERIGLPAKSEEIGVEKETVPMTFRATKDIRDKYVLSRLCWDLGIIDEFSESLL